MKKQKHTDDKEIEEMTKYDVATIAAMNSLDDMENHKLTAQQQKALFGYAAIGRKNILFDSRDQGTVVIGRTVASDYVFRTYTYEEFANAINERKPLEAW